MTDQTAGTRVAIAAAQSKDDNSEGMSYLESLPRRLVTLYLPLFIILVVLLFPFYWMGLTSIKPDVQLIDMERYNPFWVIKPTFKHISKLLFETNYPRWLWNTMYCRRRRDDTVDRSVCVGGLCDRAAALSRLGSRGCCDLHGLSGAAVDPVHSTRVRHSGLRSVRLAAVADSSLSDAADSVFDVAVDGATLRPSRSNWKNAH